jgi:hypothetical protein
MPDRQDAATQWVLRAQQQIAEAQSHNLQREFAQTYLGYYEETVGVSNLLQMTGRRCSGKRSVRQELQCKSTTKPNLAGCG